MTTAYALDLANGKLTTLEVASPSALYRDTWTDTLYFASLDDVTALFADDGRLVGTWKKTIVLPKYETFAWLYVESDFVDADGAAATATVTIFSESGATLASAVVSDRTPVRLTPFREREIVFQVESKARITNVTLASTTEELKAA